MRVWILSYFRTNWPFAWSTDLSSLHCSLQRRSFWPWALWQDPFLAFGQRIFAWDCILQNELAICLINWSLQPSAWVLLAFGRRIVRTPLCEFHRMHSCAHFFLIHHADSIVGSRRGIASCRLHRADCIVRIAYADCIVRAASCGLPDALCGLHCVSSIVCIPARISS